MKRSVMHAQGIWQGSEPGSLSPVWTCMILHEDRSPTANKLSSLIFVKLVLLCRTQCEVLPHILDSKEVSYYLSRALKIYIELVTIN